MKTLIRDIGLGRWNDAQDKEIDGWIKEVTVEDEWQEIKNKYTLLLKNFSKDVNFKNNWKILDLGCGPTCISRLLPPADKIGIDPLADRFGINGRVVDGVKVCLARGEALPFKEKKFDLVICRNVLDHAQSPLQIINEVNRVLKSKGFFILSCYTYNPFIKIVKNFSQVIPNIKNIAHPFTFTPLDLEKLVSKLFVIKKKVDIHVGYHPNDYGKINEKKVRLTQLQNLVLFINRMIFSEKWFLKEYCLICKKRK